MIEEVVVQQPAVQTRVLLVKGENEAEVDQTIRAKIIEAGIHIDRVRGVENAEEGHTRARDQGRDRLGGQDRALRLTDRAEGVLHHTTNETREGASRHDHGVQHEDMTIELLQRQIGFIFRTFSVAQYRLLAFSFASSSHSKYRRSVPVHLTRVTIFPREDVLQLARELLPMCKARPYGEGPALHGGRERHKESTSLTLLRKARP